MSKGPNFSLSFLLAVVHLSFLLMFSIPPLTHRHTNKAPSSTKHKRYRTEGEEEQECNKQNGEQGEAMVIDIGWMRGDKTRNAENEKNQEAQRGNENRLIGPIKDKVHLGDKGKENSRKVPRS